MPAFQALPGFRDFYPEDAARRNHLFRIWRQTARAFGFAEYDAPLVESLDLYRTKSGEEIESQLFAFTDKGGREVALRPEMTPTVCRMVGERAGSLKRPIKWFSVAEFFRYERAQKGRQRAFHQFNADIFGEPGPEAEIELMALLVQSFAALGLTHEDFHVRLSDRNIWFHFLTALGLSDEQAHAVLVSIDKYERSGDEAFNLYAAKFGPLEPALKARILDFAQVRALPDLEATGGALASGLPSRTGDRARDAVATFARRIAEWKIVLGGLKDMGLDAFVEVDLGVVRGLAYYTGFVFEAFDRKGDLRALAGGGRYDDLVGKLGYPGLPAAGFAVGDLTTSLLLEQRGLVPKLVSAPDAWCVIGGAAERRAALGDVQRLRAAGFRIDYPFKDAGFGKQFKAAAESGARLALIYGSDELARGVVKIRDLAGRSEREVARTEVVAAVRDQLSG